MLSFTARTARRSADTPTLSLLLGKRKLFFVISLEVDEQILIWVIGINLKPGGYYFLICSIHVLKLMCRIAVRGTIEAGGRPTKVEIAGSVNFCTSVIAKAKSGCFANSAMNENKSDGKREAAAPAAIDDRGDAMIMKIVRTRRALGLYNFSTIVIIEMASNMQRNSNLHPRGKLSQSQHVQTNVESPFH